MIPNSISYEHVLKALKEIDEAGVPPRRESRVYVLIFDDKSYPPKYIISIANKYANGDELGYNEFSGGLEANGFLRELGFEIGKK